MSRLRYWLFTTEFPPFFGGGISAYCKQMADELKQHYELTVFASDNSLEQPCLVTDEDGFRLVRFRTKVFIADDLMNAVSISKSFMEVATKFAEEQAAPDVIEAQDYLGILFAIIHEKRKAGGVFAASQLIVTSHAPQHVLDVFEGKRLPAWPQKLILALLPISLRLSFGLRKLKPFQVAEYWINSLERFCLQYADGVFYLSEFMRRLVAPGLAKLPSDIVVANPYVAPDDGLDEPPGVDFGAPPEGAYFGKLLVLKGALDLVALVDSCCWQKGLPFKLHLFGRDDYNYEHQMSSLEYLRQNYAPAFEQGLLVFHDQIPPSELKAASAKARVVFLPSRVENFSYVVLEQMGFGKICLVTQSGGQSEIVEDGVSGFVYQDGEEFARKLAVILNLGPEEYQTMSLAARQRIRSLCDPRSVFEQKDAFLRTLINKGRA